MLAYFMLPYNLSCTADGLMNKRITMVKSLQFFSLSILILLAGCGEYEEPVFDRINELQVHRIGRDFITLKGKALFKNPNELNYKVKKIHVDVIYKEKNIANISNTSKAKVVARQEFEIPFTVEVPAKEFKKNMLSDLVGLLNGKKVQLNFNGSLTVSKFGINKHVPIAYAKTIRLKL